MSENVAEAVIALRRNLRARFGLHADMELVGLMMASRLNSQVIEAIEAVIGTWSADQLAAGLEANHEAIGLEISSEEKPH